MRGRWDSAVACGFKPLAFCLLFALAAASLGAEPDSIVAKVGPEAIRTGDVARLLKTATHGKEINAAALPVLQAQVLDEIVGRRLVLAYARRTGTMPTQEEMEAALSRFKDSLGSKGQTIEEYLKAQSLAQADLRRQIAWNLVWEKYLAKYVTDARVEEFWNTRRREFDGTEVSVSHILLRSDSANGPRATDALVKEAEQLREEIASGQLSFAEAAQKRSAGPSAKDGGRLGWIGRHGPMDESFSRAAFALQPGQASPPVRTRFGVHLIRCDEVKQGVKSIEEVRKDLEDALARQLLERLAESERRHTPVEYTGKSPYFKPGTRELVTPQ